MSQFSTYKLHNRIAVYCIIGAALVFFGCQSGERQSEEASDPEAPENIRQLDSLTIYSADAESKMSVTFEEEEVFSDSVGIGIMGFLDVDERGRVYVSEGGMNENRQTIHVFNPDGSYRTNIGRAGRGPGEFAIVDDIHIKVDYLYVYDSILQRVHIFSLNNLSNVQTIVLDSQQWSGITELETSSPTRVYARSDSTFFLGFSSPPSVNQTNYRRYYIFDRDGNRISDEVFQEEDVQFYGGTGVPGPQLSASITLPSDRHSLMSVDEKGNIYSAWTEDFLIKVHDKNGKYVRSFYYPVENKISDSDKILGSFDNNPGIKRLINAHSDIPDTWPVLNRMLIDDEGRIWVSTIVDSDDYYEWWILNNKGELLARFEWPGNRLQRHTEEQKLKVIKNDRLYVYETDDDSRYGQIVRYKINFEE